MASFSYSRRAFDKTQDSEASSTRKSRSEDLGAFTLTVDGDRIVQPDAVDDKEKKAERQVVRTYSSLSGPALMAKHPLLFSKGTIVNVSAKKEPYVRTAGGYRVYVRDDSDAEPTYEDTQVFESNRRNTVLTQAEKQYADKKTLADPLPILKSSPIPASGPDGMNVKDALAELEQLNLDQATPIPSHTDREHIFTSVGLTNPFGLAPVIGYVCLVYIRLSLSTSVAVDTNPLGTETPRRPQRAN
jgi:hypothetical protein